MSRSDIDAARTAAARAEAIDFDREVLTMPAAAALYGCSEQNIRQCVARAEGEAVRLTCSILGREVRLIDKAWADDRWREGAGPGYGERLARLREDGMTMFWAGPWLLLGVAADSRIVEAN